MRPLLVALTTAVTLVALPAAAGGFSVSFPTLTYPAPQPDVLKGCVDATTVKSDICTKK
ncbi:hypothetical protein [Parasulfitobacter algicola]|uniref:Uncharacterized protein n=1 Tax=Parasulfitobacter algicola TaxID=2614809 RepID=A0ABX2IT26_9RHOB|nr:hypothetical protein [Sulfitobacter algicola]NSX56041.1 hypothetical protein [Sulfitobacter algicola]